MPASTSRPPQNWPAERRHGHRLGKKGNGAVARGQVRQGVSNQPLPAQVTDHRQRQQHQPALCRHGEEGLAGCHGGHHQDERTGQAVPGHYDDHREAATQAFDRQDVAAVEHCRRQGKPVAGKVSAATGAAGPHQEPHAAERQHAADGEQFVEPLAPPACGRLPRRSSHDHRKGSDRARRQNAVVMGPTSLQRMKTGAKPMAAAPASNAGTARRPALSPGAVAVDPGRAVTTFGPQEPCAPAPPPVRHGGRRA